MHLYLVLMLANDCSQYVYAAYARQSSACEAVARCEKFEKVWQYEASVARAATEQVHMRDNRGRVVGSFWPGDVNLCVVQRVGIDVDDQVQDIVCP